MHDAYPDPAREVIRWAVLPTPLGAALLAASDKGVCRLAFGEGVADLARHFPQARLVEGGAGLPDLARRVLAVLDKPELADAIALDVRGTPFQQAVWQALRAIPAGQTRSYAQIAAAVGRPGAVRATGGANGANPVAVLIPCHRVIRADGSLGGYAYGPAIKQALLAREGALPYIKE